MLRTICVSMILAAIASMGLAATVRAGEPEIYYFGASGCGFCEDGLAFLNKLQKEDRRIHLHTYDIVAYSDDAAIFIRLSAAIGFTNPQVPLTVIGNHAIVGYQDDESTGTEIRLTIEQCRLKSCPDMVHGLLPFEPEMTVSEMQSGWIIERRFAKASQER